MRRPVRDDTLTVSGIVGGTRPTSPRIAVSLSCTIDPTGRVALAILNDAALEAKVDAVCEVVTDLRELLASGASANGTKSKAKAR